MLYYLPSCEVCGRVYGHQRDLLDDYISYESRGEGGCRDRHTCPSCTETLRRAESQRRHPSSWEVMS